MLSPQSAVFCYSKISFATAMDAVICYQYLCPSRCPTQALLALLTAASPGLHPLHWGRQNGMAGQCQRGRSLALILDNLKAIPAAELPMDGEASAEAALRFSFSSRGSSPHSLDPQVVLAGSLLNKFPVCKSVSWRPFPGNST